MNMRKLRKTYNNDKKKEKRKNVNLSQYLRGVAWELKVQAQRGNWELRRLLGGGRGVFEI